MFVAPDLLSDLHQHTIELDQSGAWPAEQFEWLARAGVLGWVIPAEFGGSDISQADLLSGYEQLSTACLTTAFILTQRNGACQRIAGCQNSSLKERLLPSLAKGELFATVGISHLTTSRQHLRTPAVAVDITGESLRLNGSIPWVTGASHADLIVTGGTCPDGQQVLIALPTDLPGISIQPHAKLMSLTASHTATVELKDVILSKEHLLAGPVHEVMKQGLGGGTGSQVTSVLAVGLSSRSLKLIQEQEKLRPDLAEFAAQFGTELNELREDLFRSVTANPNTALSCPTAAEIRQRANSLVLRITQAAITISKGMGFVQGHPAELAVREAMFFLVWSCPQPVAQGLLQELACSS
ncbi:acyl-CoA dehydrogenase family protein [Planctomicrobium sp. SH661]|uniref:acyl-CoA dehydrogenase family protein n=1 Tax=Planctomicrobium sp. SH661 TaxID=3448124 RepID=UPI003F5B7A05